MSTKQEKKKATTTLSIDLPKTIWEVDIQRKILNIRNYGNSISNAYTCVCASVSKASN